MRIHFRCQFYNNIENEFGSEKVLLWRFHTIAHARRRAVCIEGWSIWAREPRSRRRPRVFFAHAQYVWRDVLCKQQHDLTFLNKASLSVGSGARNRLLHSKNKYLYWKIWLHLTFPIFLVVIVIIISEYSLSNGKEEVLEIIRQWYNRAILEPCVACI